MKSPCLPHDSQTSFGLKISAFLLGHYLLSESQQEGQILNEGDVDSKISDGGMTETKGSHLSEQ